VAKALGLSKRQRNPKSKQPKGRIGKKENGDYETVIGGSFDLTKAAEENNAENLLVIHDRKLASLYMKNWQEHFQHSEVYAGR